MRRSLSYLLAVISLFGLLGAGVGLAANFTISFFIEQFVQPGTDPLDSTQIGIMLLVAIFVAYTAGPIVAGIAGAWVGRNLPEREALAGIIAGTGGFAGFYVFIGLALLFTFSVLAEFSAPGGGGGGGGGPLDPSGLVTLMVQVSLLTGLVGFGTAYLTSRID
ncbi:hypothetical protein HWV23_16930 [Natronomonas halophila]|uniref:hypothetical protein n=1 Tax=Natronomonas halophila TaxID=2747817 RepID=UPI0015B4507C|nr:hypothetical protein [Natronomonas halophila]QLD87336.1 hypothetical protein HWV23_16930 [Natronomonas halophila]